MQTSADKSRINRILGNHGLPQLGGPGVLEAFGFLIRDHDHFRSILDRCEPSERRNCYEAMRPHLRFEAKPLDVYLSESGAVAEEMQWPTLAADGTVQPFRTAEIQSYSDYAKWRRQEFRAAEVRSQVEAAVQEAVSKHYLRLVCRKCTREAHYHGTSKADAVHQARQDGWTYGLDPNKGAGEQAYEICPECPVASN